MRTLTSSKYEKQRPSSRSSSPTRKAVGASMRIAVLLTPRSSDPARVVNACMARRAWLAGAATVDDELRADYRGSCGRAKLWPVLVADPRTAPPVTSSKAWLAAGKA
jgi:hypothetical protein